MGILEQYQFAVWTSVRMYQDVIVDSIRTHYKYTQKPVNHETLMFLCDNKMQDSTLFDFGVKSVVWYLVNEKSKARRQQYEDLYWNEPQLRFWLRREVREYGKLQYEDLADWFGCQFHSHPEDAACSLEQADIGNIVQVSWNDQDSD